jgi:hypothetical protein
LQNAGYGGTVVQVETMNTIHTEQTQTAQKDEDVVLKKIWNALFGYPEATKESRQLTPLREVMKPISIPRNEPKKP